MVSPRDLMCQWKVKVQLRPFMPFTYARPCRDSWLTLSVYVKNENYLYLQAYLCPIQ